MSTTTETQVEYGYRFDDDGDVWDWFESPQEVRDYITQAAGNEGHSELPQSYRGTIVVRTRQLIITDWEVVPEPVDASKDADE